MAKSLQPAFFLLSGISRSLHKLFFAPSWQGMGRMHHTGPGHELICCVFSWRRQEPVGPVPRGCEGRGAGTGRTRQSCCSALDINLEALEDFSAVCFFSCQIWMLLAVPVRAGGVGVGDLMYSKSVGFINEESLLRVGSGRVCLSLSRFVHRFHWQPSPGYWMFLVPTASQPARRDTSPSFLFPSLLGPLPFDTLLRNAWSLCVALAWHALGKIKKNNNEKKKFCWFLTPARTEDRMGGVCKG